MVEFPRTGEIIMTFEDGTEVNARVRECTIQEAELMQYLLGSPIIYDTYGRVYTIVDKTYPKAWKLGVERGH